jgi:hypothetical protein
MAATYVCERGEVRLIGDWADKLAPKLPPQPVERLSLNARHGWQTTGDIRFVLAFKDVRAMRIVCFEKLDLSPLAELNNLKELHLQLYPKIRHPFDFSTLPQLESLSIYWNHGFKSLQGLRNANRLVIKEIYGIKDLDLSGLENLKNLDIVTGRGVRSLSLAGVCALESLVLVGVPNLAMIRGFCAGESVKKLNLSKISKVPPVFWKQFTALECVETTMKERISESSFGRSPKSFVRWLE